MREVMEGLAGEARRAPFTSAAVLLGWGFMVLYLVPRAIEAKATAITTETIQRQIVTVAMRVSDIEIALAKDRLVAIEGQLYDVEREEALFVRARQQVPDVVSQRLHRLRAERSVADQELGALIARRLAETAEK